MTTSSLYVRRNVSNGDDIARWAYRSGFTSVTDPSDMHVTIAHSKVPVNIDNIEIHTSNIHVPGNTSFRNIKPLGDKGAVVLCFRHPTLHQRWAELKNTHGCVWGFPDYTPHITLSYLPQDINLSNVNPYNGPIFLGPEVHETVGSGWEPKERYKIPSLMASAEAVVVASLGALPPLGLGPFNRDRTSDKELGSNKMRSPVRKDIDRLVSGGNKGSPYRSLRNPDDRYTFNYR